MAQATDSKPRPFLHHLVLAFVVRPRLVSSLAFGIACFLGLTFLHHGRWVVHAVVAWDAVCVVFLGSLLPLMMETDTDQIRAKAGTQDVGQGVILALAVLAAATSISAVAAELAVAKNAKGFGEIIRIALGFGTVALSWAFVQSIFALHYAHEFYGPSDDPNKTERGGLAFPGGDEPDYWDFVHFSIIIGVASQTADIAFTAKGLRRIGSVHGILAFVFNTVVLALTINMVAGLFT